MKILLTIFLLSGFLHASYKKAQSYYDNKEYALAIQEAKSSTDEYANPKLHLVWAKSAEALGLTKDAMSAYERVAMLDAEDSSSRVALVKIYNKTGRTALADALMQELKNYTLTPQERNSLKLLKHSTTSSIEADATLSIGHDSNINVSTDGRTLDTIDPTVSHEGEIATLFSRVDARVSYVHDLESKGGWYLRGDAKLYYQNNFDAPLYNMFVGDFEAGVGYASSGYTLYLPVAYSYVHYLDVPLITQINLQPRANITLAQDWILNLNLKYTNRDYTESKYKGMSDSSYGGGAGLYYVFGKNYLLGRVLYENFNSQEELHFYYIDRSVLTLNAALNYRLSSWLVGKFDYRYRRGEYKDRSDVADTTSALRADNYNQVEVKLSHSFTKNYELYLCERYAKNSSNYLLAEYTKNIVMFGLRANY